MKKISGAIIWFFLLSLIISLGAFPPGARASPQGQIGPLNPAFEQKTQELKALTWQKGGGQSNFGYFPSPLDWSHLRGKRILSSTQSSFPSSYDLRALGKVPPVRDQGSYSTCWAFAALGSLESVLLPSESWNFSEDNLLNTSGFDPDPYTGGGNYDMATAYLARWSGPVREDQDPYPTPGFITFPPSKHVQEVLYLPPRSGPLDNDTIKSALMSYGGVYTSIYWQDSYYNPQKYSYFYSGSQIPNHAVVIVGWNDDYPASNFSNTPSGKGAFIVRNSWGSSWGEGGYFYVSYYDTRIGGELAVFNNAEPTDNYTNIYQYDPLGWTASYGFGSNTAWFANRFSAQGKETLKAVSFYTASLDSSFQIYYGTSLSSLQLLSSGTISLSGYHTLNLNTPVALSPGQVFFIAVKLTTPGYPYPVPVEAPIPKYSSHASASSNQSFVSSDGVNWSDITQQYPNTNVCLKAFTSSESSSPTTPLLFLSPESLDFGTELTQLSFTVRNDGGGTLNWSASESIPWVVSLSPASGSLGTGKTQSVTVTVDRQGLSPGNYTGSISLSSNGGSKEVEVKMDVPVSDAVTITNLPSTLEILEHQPLSFQVQASDSLGHPLTFTLLSGPGTINSSTGQFNWNDPTPAGEYQSKIRATCLGGKWDEKVLTIKVRERNATFTYSLQSGWNMISLPLVTDTNPLNLFSEITGAWYLYQWDPVSYSYKGRDEILLQPGRGYWLWVQSPQTISIQGASYSANEMRLSLSFGWNLMGYPFLSPMNWEDVRIEVGSNEYTLDQAASLGIISPYLYWWNGTNYSSLKDLGSFEPGKGFWMLALQDCTLIFRKGLLSLPLPAP